MQFLARREPLNGVDHAWLRMESAVNPMVITALLVLEGPLAPGRLEAVLEERLLPHPRFRQRVVRGTLLGTPRWEPDPRFDVRAHVIREKLPPPGGKAWLEVRVGELFGKPMDHRRPLWDMHVIDGYEGGTAVICRFHHAMADGMALLQILLSLTDGEAAAPHRREHHPGARNGVLPADLLSDLLDPEKVLRLARKGANGVAALGRILLLPPDRATPIRGRLTSRKVASWSNPVEVSALKEIGRRARTTVNDVLQAAIAGAIGRYLEGRGLSPHRLADLRAVVPVDLRPPDRPPDTGNFFGLVFLEMPVGIRDPLERLAEMKRRMDRLKATPEAAAIFRLLLAIGHTSSRVEELALRLFGSKATMVMSNVPGPREVRRLGGQAIKDILFWVPESGGLGLGVSFFSYHGKVRVGVVTDASLVPDPRRITDAFEREIAALTA